MATAKEYAGNSKVVESFDDERSIGNGVIVTLIPGLFFYDDCGVKGYDTLGEAIQDIKAIEKANGGKK